MNKEGIFFTCVLIIITLNVVAWGMTLGKYTIPGLEGKNIDISQMALNGLVGIAVSAIITAGLMSISAFSFSMDSKFIKIIFVTAVILNLFFSVSTTYKTVVDGEVRTETLGVGVGLLTNIYNVFDNNDWFMLGKISVTILGLLTYITGLMMVVE